MKQARKIKQILIDQVGWIYQSNGDIEPFEVTGEMAMITWYRQGNSEFNGKYVIQIDYD